MSYEDCNFTHRSVTNQASLFPLSTACDCRNCHCSQVALVNGDRLLGEEAAALAVRYPDRVYARYDLLSRINLGTWGRHPGFSAGRALLMSSAESDQSALQPVLTLESGLAGQGISLASWQPMSLWRTC
jgi:hypothetical protein